MTTAIKQRRRSSATNQPGKSSASTIETLADLVKKLGGVPLERIRMQPNLGTATEKDLLAALEASHKRICELVDGVLVEKTMGSPEALFAANIIRIMGGFVDENDLGVVLGADGPLRLTIGLVRIPDVSFISWDRLPGGEFPDEPIPALVPNLAIEVISQGNTKKEMKRKLGEFFEAGVQIVWLIYPKTRAAEVYTSPVSMQRIDKDESLDGGDVLPGFTLPLTQLFTKTKRRRKER